MGTSTKRFRIAFSFAGEKREFVAKVAAVVARRFSEDRILYDKYHRAEFARNDLGIYLPELYNREADLVVVVVCPNYDVKEWTGLEWLAIHDLLQQRHRDEVMLCRFDHAHVAGLYRGAGFIELNHETPKSVATLILERLALNECLPRDHYHRPPTPVPTTSLPHNLPTLQPFFGREEELRKIADALDPESRTWGVLIDGPGGMGKTSLAIRAAYAVSPETFQRIVFVSLKTRELDDDGLRDLSGFILSGLTELFSALARQLGHNDILEKPDDQRPRLLLDTLRGKRILLLLDNLESLTKPERDTVFTFVTRLPQCCKAILTCRNRIGSVTEELILEKLSENAAMSTLSHLATRVPLLARTSEAERVVLYRETGGNPLLLRWTAGQLGRGHCLTFTSAIAFLRSRPDGNDPLGFLFKEVLADLGEEEIRLLSALTFFIQPAKVEHLAEIADLPEPDVERALGRLVNRSLAVPSEEFHAFALVPLVTGLVLLNSPVAFVQTLERLTQRVYALIVENGLERPERFPVLDAAWPIIVPALEYFAGFGPSSKLQTICTFLHPFLQYTGKTDLQLALYQIAESRACAADDFASAGWRAYGAAMIFRSREQANQELACAERATSHWRAAGDPAYERGFAIQMRGFSHEYKKDYTAAIAAYREAIELHRGLNLMENPGIVSFLASTALAEERRGDFVAADREFRAALSEARSDWDNQGVALNTSNLARVALTCEEWTLTESLAREALTLCEKIGWQHLISWV